jgi:hypothetical protein
MNVGEVVIGVTTPDKRQEKENDTQGSVKDPN